MLAVYNVIERSNLPIPGCLQIMSEKFKDLHWSHTKENVTIISFLLEEQKPFLTGWFCSFPQSLFLLVAWRSICRPEKVLRSSSFSRMTRTHTHMLYMSAQCQKPERDTRKDLRASGAMKACRKASSSSSSSQQQDHYVLQYLLTFLCDSPRYLSGRAREKKEYLDNANYDDNNNNSALTSSLFVLIDNMYYLKQLNNWKHSFFILAVILSFHAPSKCYLCCWHSFLVFRI